MGWWRKKKKKPQPPTISAIVSNRGEMLLEDLIHCCDGKSNPIKFFSADDIRKATDNFSESNHVSELSDFDYEWYSGKNENYHHKILVNKFYSYGVKNFCRDIAISSIVSGHKNFMKLVGCCLESEDSIMVYQGVKKYYKLDISEQPWIRRMKIAEDMATALAYLHTALPKPFVYRSMCLANIILDEDGIAKLSDFSSCVSIPQGETFVQVDGRVGTFGYMDKKYIRNCVVSEETDVFAIGAVMQELLMGEKRFRSYDEEEVEADGEGYDDDDDDYYDPATMRRFKFMMQRRINEIADPEMLEKMGEISEQELCQMKAFGMLSLRCIGLNGEVPTMVEVTKELKKIQRCLNNDSSSSTSREKEGKADTRLWLG